MITVEGKRRATVAFIDYAKAFDEVNQCKLHACKAQSAWFLRKFAASEKSVCPSLRSFAQCELVSLAYILPL